MTPHAMTPHAESHANLWSNACYALAGLAVALAPAPAPLALWADLTGAGLVVLALGSGAMHATTTATRLGRLAVWGDHVGMAATYAPLWALALAAATGARWFVPAAALLGTLAAYLLAWRQSGTNGSAPVLVTGGVASALALAVVAVRAASDVWEGLWLVLVGPVLAVALFLWAAQFNGSHVRRYEHGTRHSGHWAWHVLTALGTWHAAAFALHPAAYLP